MAEQDFIKAGYSIVGTEDNENKLLSFLKEHYPSVLKDNEIDLNELKAIAGLPIDEKVNGYGLNFVGRNFARAKYAQKTEKELQLNRSFSKDIDTTQNLVLKGDNLDSLKILKNYYSGQINCIYIDPPYNTTSEEFVYPDRFDKEEAEVLGLANLSESDFARMEFSFKSKKSHNGWLAFMYPRLLLARDLLSKEGVIFINIDDNEQANLKLLCDDIFGEENFVTTFTRVTKKGGKSSDATAKNHDYVLTYVKNISQAKLQGVSHNDDGYSNQDEYFEERGFYKINQTLDYDSLSYVKSLDYPIEIDGETFYPGGDKNIWESRQSGKHGRADWAWRWSKDLYEFGLKNGFIEVKRGGNRPRIYTKTYQNVKISKDENGYKIVKIERSKPLSTLEFTDNKYSNDNATKVIDEIIGKGVFEYTKPPELINQLVKLINEENFIVLDFFAGSGTTGQALMELNKDGGKRKFILCQIDEPIDPVKKKDAYEFCTINNLPHFISSITIERIKRAGEKIAKDIEAENSKTGLFEEDKKQVPDIGFKVFDSVEAPTLKVDETGQISITENDTDTLSRIYNMIFTVGLDEPTQVPEEVVKDSIYKIGNHYYITNSEKITSDDYSNAIKNGKVFIDGWTASLNGTLQNYKEDVKIVF
ncbi:MAG: site-specific DNA-methyltransferase [Flavobacteriales bacterium]|nr:site-specific DNA-methyltransferase [Flavobacteriales bacterium]MCW8912050.1 site-specific DNA-methyltransferase [Flavobacteriales bacterium]MCW8936690.1 site-specific DNA-methyltransferase [Flavobacteriales bacterium]MCW8940694.1 site-specific DNA-methyltransferase [Flavobacteriales bacterium]MCW8967095.1 site-specific DNA-methyltransferase [Flavobacteriales bacterium]